jgi:uncharacterized protein YceK
MKQFLTLAAAAVVVATLSGCGSLRTPTNGPRADKTYYSTFFGLSIESAVWGDGIIPGVDTK